MSLRVTDPRRYPPQSVLEQREYAPFLRNAGFPGSDFHCSPQGLLIPSSPGRSGTCDSFLMHRDVLTELASAIGDGVRLARNIPLSQPGGVATENLSAKDRFSAADEDSCGAPLPGADSEDEDAQISLLESAILRFMIAAVPGSSLKSQTEILRRDLGLILGSLLSPDPSSGPNIRSDSEPPEAPTDADSEGPSIQVGSSIRATGSSVGAGCSIGAVSCVGAVSSTGAVPSVGAGSSIGGGSPVGTGCSNGAGCSNVAGCSTGAGSHTGAGCSKAAACSIGGGSTIVAGPSIGAGSSIEAGCPSLRASVREEMPYEQVEEFNPVQLPLHPDMTFRAVMEAWMSEHARKIKYSTRSTYLTRMNAQILPALGDLPVSSISEEVLMDFTRSLSAGNLQPGSIRATLQIVRSVLRFLQSKEPNYSAPNVERPKARSLPPRVLTQDEQFILQTCLDRKNTRVAAGIRLMLSTGLRVGELCALRSEDISLEGCYVLVRRTLQRVRVEHPEPDGPKTALLFSTPKSEASVRKVPLSGRIIALIRDKVPTRDGTFFLTGTENPMEPRQFQKVFQHVLAECEIGPDENGARVHPHTLRHTCATRCIEMGMDVKFLSANLGHSSVQTTMDRYVHPSLDIRIGATDLLKDLNM